METYQVFSGSTAVFLSARKMLLLGQGSASHKKKCVFMSALDTDGIKCRYQTSHSRKQTIWSWSPQPLQRDAPSRHHTAAELCSPMHFLPGEVLLLAMERSSIGWLWHAYVLRPIFSHNHWLGTQTRRPEKRKPIYNAHVVRMQMQLPFIPKQQKINWKHISQHRLWQEASTSLSDPF